MTDKEKIRAEVERLRKSYQIMYQELDCESPELMSVCAKRNLCQDILIFIDSLQEEPKPKFHIGDTIRHKEEKDSFKVFAIEDDCYRLENNIVVSIAAQDNWEVVEEPTPHYPKSKEASGTLKKMLDNITKESLAKARKQLEEEYVSKDLEEVVKDLWQEINTGHQYSILDSYNQFYGMCLDVCDWQKQQMIDKALDWAKARLTNRGYRDFKKYLENDDIQRHRYNTML